MSPRWILSAVLAALLAAPALSQGGQSDPATTARRAANQLAAMQLALSEADGASDRVKALTGVIRAYEEGLVALRTGLRRATIREAALRQHFEAERGRLSRLLGVLQAIEASPAPLLLLHPSGPVRTARSGMIVAEIAPALRREAETLRADLQELTVLRTLQESAADTLTEGLRGVQEARTRLSQAISNRTDLPRRYLADPEAMSRLIESSETLDSFASGLVSLDGITADTPVKGAFDIADGSLPMPVTGRVLRGFNEADAAGIRRPGLILAAPPRALVSTPAAATIRYRGPLLDYGNVMILEPGGGTLLVLAGLEQVYGEVGQVLAAGAPVGLMGGDAPDADTFLAQARDRTGADLPETLYMELRQGDQPVDPTDWFAIE